MNYFSKIKVGTWIVIILTIINLASLGTILYKTSCNRGFSHDKFKEQSQRQKFGGFWRNLDLDTIQKDEFKKMGMHYFDTIKSINKYRDNLALQIADELKKDLPDTSRIFSICKEMGNNYTRQKMVTIMQIMGIKKKCRPDQLLKLDSMYYYLFIGFENPRPGRHKRPISDSIKSINRELDKGEQK